MEKILVGCCVFFIFFVLAVAALGYLSYRHAAKSMSERPQIPPALENPSVLIGSDFLVRTTFFEDASLGGITDIVVGELDPSPGAEIGIAGSRGAVFLGEDLGVKSRVIFGGQGSHSHIDIIDVDADGVCEFMDRGAWGQEASLIDHDGDTMWTYGGRMPGVNDMAAGDIDRDGRMEYVVGFNGWGGVHLLDESGKKIWKRSDNNVWHVEMVDTDGVVGLEIVHSNASGKIVVRDKEGKIISRSRPFHYFSQFSLLRRPADVGFMYAMLAGNNGICLFDFQGKMVERFDAPDCGSLGHARGAAGQVRGRTGRISGGTRQSQAVGKDDALHI